MVNNFTHVCVHTRMHLTIHMPHATQQQKKQIRKFSKQYNINNRHMKSEQRRCNILTSHQRPYNVLLTSCTGWINNEQCRILRMKTSLCPKAKPHCASNWKVTSNNTRLQYKIEFKNPCIINRYKNMNIFSSSAIADFFVRTIL